ncbi:hypothetical protein A2841_03375 [Candidatus Kaiserbacteria bacterium RIFCSPHIGHO2_01_FULL_48_10]|uniref:Uncharacterized protein n=1 Tax=Candidatus Kaiserbacteria bacterium RIFCSPHIGHO2_01_FULL_48_10 TaxID=1798476 RepID=A0A1F6CCH8_9BACT|nr:MAG: hypothetical protein A2841_03375 [Candidatus Kaiserbacteria bacterium RIFCSPHIGHO2_01_FULL_48_10]
MKRERPPYANPLAGARILKEEAEALRVKSKRYIKYMAAGTIFNIAAAVGAHSEDPHVSSPAKIASMLALLYVTGMGLQVVRVRRDALSKSIEASILEENSKH